MSSQTTDAAPIGIGIVGLGKIAHDQHIPAIEANPAFKLIAYASPTSAHTTLEGFKDMGAMLAAHPDIQAVSLCTPPTVRFALARQALEAGRAVLLEKPPGSTLGEVDALRDLAAARKQTIFAAWHAREAPAVDPAKAWLAGRKLKSARIIWKEDVRHWHPGQEWVWSPGALGVFDPGINALSILTKLLDERVIVKAAELFVPANRQTPIAANLDMATETGTPIRAEFDWRQTGEQIWNVELETDRGTAVLSQGGSKLEVDGKVLAEAPEAEYPGLYRVFAGLVRAGRSELDAEPLRVAADAFLLGARTSVEAFSF